METNCTYKEFSIFFDFKCCTKGKVYSIAIHGQDVTRLLLCGVKKYIYSENKDYRFIHNIKI